MKVLFVSNLFPNIHEPARGVFNYHQVRHLAERCEVRVVAPVSWFFLKGRHAPPAPVPAVEEPNGLTVWHPKNFYLPKIGRTLNPWLYAVSLRPVLARLHRQFPFDVILVNWAYPDGCGIARIARSMGLPFVMSISGSDANVYLGYQIRRRQILRMLDQARAITVRSRALQQLLRSHQVDSEKIHVVYNGVDRRLFTPQPRAEVRRRLQIGDDQTILLYVGRLSPEKGLADLLRAMATLRDVHHLTPRLLAVGGGPEKTRLQQQAVSLGLEPAVTWVGWVKPEGIAEYLSAADLLCLPSHMEGVPNAALEAFSCGLPVVASSVGGIPEVVSPETAVLAPPQDPTGLAAALKDALSRRWDSGIIRAHSERFDWFKNAEQLHGILEAATR